MPRLGTERVRRSPSTPRTTEVSPWAALGAGLDHHAFQVGGLVMRVTAPASPHRAEVTGEAASLRLVAARLPLPVPAQFADPVRGRARLPAAARESAGGYWA